jgi:hypothetical protein
MLTVKRDDLRICASGKTDELNGPGLELGNPNPLSAKRGLTGPPGFGDYPTCGCSPDTASGLGSQNNETSTQNAGCGIAKTSPVSASDGVKKSSPGSYCIVGMRSQNAGQSALPVLNGEVAVEVLSQTASSERRRRLVPCSEYLSTGALCPNPTTETISA